MSSEEANVKLVRLRMEDARSADLTGVDAFAST
jgi:hypothetical protein